MNVEPDLDVLQAFRLIDSLLETGPRRASLLALRDRLVGELLSDCDRVASTLAEDFALRTVMGGSSTMTDRNALIASIRRQNETEAMMWMELEDLVVGETALAGQGTLRMRRAASEAPASAYVTSIPLAFFLRFHGGLMNSEVIFMETPGPESTVLRTGPWPSKEELRAQLEQP